ncbi:uncharacterized protein BDR25DRAFT_327994 [Lindgomyces ingoldianus]|uniref:Uncharacterized protein n=1 Tax=Lindgomyces ingoldianus TaxID=673940 RepID=A0ACB6QIA3_9PLEO|nr:uncharacterized protein BDR25DRAFT_327994 [Lindgomyces ingoldianus]KAF2466651.1 hypothetical protein BDR25DRAFT_327994 [Lindgomyces ingoldianus]
MRHIHDVELLEQVGKLLGDEARNKNVYVLFVPTEIGEDPVLSDTLGAAFVRGLQYRDSIEDNVCMMRRTLRELHLLPFQLAYPFLLRTILREEWGFDGLTMSDWGGTYSTSEAMNPGLDSEMPGPTVFWGRALSWAVSSRMVLEGARVMPHGVSSSDDPAAANTVENQVLICRIASEGVVLLKNARNILPIKQGEKKTSALIGNHIMNPALGGGSSEVELYYTVTQYDATVEEVGREQEIFEEDPGECSHADPLLRTTSSKNLIDIPESLRKLFIDGTESIDLWTDRPPETGETPVLNRVSIERFADFDALAGKPARRAIGTAATPTARIGGFEAIDEDQAIREAAELVKVVEFLTAMTGLSIDYEYAESDRKALRLPNRLDELIEAVLSTNPNTIVVTQSGLPIEMPWVDKEGTVLHARFGRFSMTFSKALRHTPVFLTFGKVDPTILYGKGVFIGHRYYEKIHHLYPMFELAKFVVLSVFEASPDHEMKVSVKVSNAGPYAGAGVVQIYVQYLTSSIQRPIRELKGFKKVRIGVGTTASVELRLGKYPISFWCEEHSRWKAEQGQYVVIVERSTNPQDDVLRKSFTLEETFYWSGL